MAIPDALKRVHLPRIPTLLTLLLCGLFLAAPAEAADSLTPATVDLTLAPGESRTIAKNLHLDAAPAKADIVFAVDTSGYNMRQALPQLKTDLKQAMDDVQAVIPAARFAVMDFGDYPTMPVEPPTSYPYRLVTPLTDKATAKSAVDSLTGSLGGDLADSLNRVFFEAYSDTALAYDPEAERLLVLASDTMPHDANLKATFPNCGFPYAIDQPPTDFGRDGAPGGGDDLETLPTLNALNANNVTLLAALYEFGNVPLQCYRDLAAKTGGDAIEFLDGESSATLFTNLIKSATTKVKQVKLEVSPSSFSSWVSFAPAPPYGPFTAPTDVTFNETITVPAGTAPGIYSFEVRALADGARRAVEQVTVTVTPINVVAKPTTLTLAPKTAESRVGQQYCVTATVKDQLGATSPNVTVRFSVSGSAVIAASDASAANGEAKFCYTRPKPGTDTITAYADTDGDNTKDADEPSDTATKKWLKKRPPDFDGDGKMDMGVWRPGNAYWFVRQSTGNWDTFLIQQWGASNSIPLPNSDFDGDGKADTAIFHPPNATWYVRLSSTGGFLIRQHGASNSIPFANTDFDGDGKADMAIWHPPNGTWYVRLSSQNWDGSLIRQWGVQGMIPIGNTDFDGDGKADMVVWYPANGTWYVRLSSQNWNGTLIRQWGLSGDLPLGDSDFDGDGKADMAVWRPRDGTWYVRTSSTNWDGYFYRQWGASNSLPLANTDFDGDGKADMVIWHPPNGTWYVRLSSQNWDGYLIRQWGLNGDYPFANSDFDGDGKADMAVWRPSNGYWYVRTSSTNWDGYFYRQWGQNGDIPLGLNWFGWHFTPYY